MKLEFCPDISKNCLFHAGSSPGVHTIKGKMAKEKN